jgi:flavodoxin I
MDKVDLTGKKAAVFGTGESFWEEFCKAVDTIESKVKDMHAQVVVPGFKWDGSLTEQAVTEIKEWAKQIH